MNFSERLFPWALRLGAGSSCGCASLSMPLVSARTVGKLLGAAKQTVAIAESSSGGAISARLLAVPGASSFFAGGMVVYSSQSKHTLLGLEKAASSPSATKQHALELAAAARTTLGTDWGVGETGVAGPTKNSRGIQPGVTAIAVVGPAGLAASQILLPASELSSDRDAYGEPAYRTNPTGRAENMESFATAAVSLLLETVTAQADAAGDAPPAAQADTSAPVDERPKGDLG